MSHLNPESHANQKLTGNQQLNVTGFVLKFSMNQKKSKLLDNETFFCILFLSMMYLKNLNPKTIPRRKNYLNYEYMELVKYISGRFIFAQLFISR